MANTLNIKVENNKVLTESILNGVDASNLIASFGDNVKNPKTYTATTDCIMYCQKADTGTGSIKLDNVTIIEYWEAKCGYSIPLKKDQKVALYHGDPVGYQTIRYRVYGIKR